MLKHKRLIISLAIFFVSLVFLFVFFRQGYVVPVLMYHSVNPVPLAGKMLTVSPKTFERQMRFLKEHHYRVLPLKELAILIKEKKKVPRHTLAITFDDGYKDNYTYVLPILEKYNLPATIFIIVNEVERYQGDRLSWDEIKNMQDSGLIDIGSHTLSHPYLTEVDSQEELKKEIFDSKKMLEEKLHRNIDMFSYPAGRFNSKIKQLVKEAGYKLAVATSPGSKFPNDDLFLLKRLRISQNSDNLFIFWIETSGFYNFIRERHHR